MTDYKAFGGSAKAVGRKRFGGYAVRFTSPQATDLHGEYFDKTTDFLLPSFPLKGGIVLYQHALDPEIACLRVGDIDLLEERPDGIYVEGTLRFKEYADATIKSLHRPDEWKKEQMSLTASYEEHIEELLESGVLKFSSGALPQTVVIDDVTNHIKQWGMVEVSLTPTPAAPRGETQINLLKASQDDNGQPIEHPDAKEDSLRVSDGGGYEAHEQTTQPNESEVKHMSSIEKNESVNAKMDGEDDEDENAKLAQETAEAEKMDGEDEEEDDMPEKEKSIDVQALVASAIADYQKGIDAKAEAEAKKAKAEKAKADELKAIVDAQVKSALEAQAGTYARESAGAKSTTPQISVAEPNLYRDLSASDMALGVKLYASKLGDMKRFLAPTLGSMFSEGYLKSMANKMAVEMNNLKTLDPRDKLGLIDRADMKAAFPFKTNELNASDITNQGDEWATVWYDTNLWERAREDVQLFNLLSARGMRQVTVPQGAESVDVYLETSSGTVYTGRQANSTNAVGKPEQVVDITSFGTDKINVPLSKHTLSYAITYELEERSIINVVQLVNNDMRQTLAEALEDGLINGDTTMTASTNINLNDGTPATTTFGQTPLYIWADGIRHAYLVDHTARKSDHSGANLSMIDYEAVLQLFDNRFRTRRGNMLFIIDTKTESATRKLPELLTQDTTGGRGTMFTGVIQPQFGVDIYTSGYMPRTGSAGTISSAGSESGANVLGGIACVYAPFWQYSRQREIMIESDRDIYAQSTGMVASVTHNFRRRGDNAAAGKYNITVV